MAKFDSKSFNPQAFKYLVDRVPNLRTNEMRKSRALVANAEIKSVFSSQNGTSYARLAQKGLLDGTAVNYDGQTDITATSTKTYERGVVVVGRAKAWTEKDFSEDITGGVDFMGNIAAQVASYMEELDQDILYAVLDGIFSMTGTQNAEFVKQHTYDITKVGDGVMTATTLNSATNQACGANKKKFSLVFLHSNVATNLENLNLLNYLKYTDPSGVQRDLGMATWNGKLVVIDDYLPTSEDADGNTVYTSYVLGQGAIDFVDIGAKVPHEMDRNPARNGGEDTLYTRMRKVFAPYGISYEKVNQSTLSPTNAELKDGKNWCLIHSGEADEESRSYINHKAIPIARIKSLG